MGVVFMHVPKTAGTSLADGLAVAMAPEQALRGYDRSLFGAFDGFDAFGSSLREQIFHSPDELPADAGLVIGHFAHSTLLTAFPNGRFMTVLREPVTRLLSHWLYWRQLSDTALADWAGWRDVVQKSHSPLASFLGDPAIAAQTDNLMTRALLWPHHLIPPDGFIAESSDRRLYRLARAKLRTFDFVDLVENERLADRIGDWLGRPFELPSLNTTSRMPAALRTPLAHELGPASLRLLETRSRIDLRLWRLVAARMLPGTDVDGLRMRIVLAAIARYGAVMAGG